MYSMYIPANSEVIFIKYWVPLLYPGQQGNNAFEDDSITGYGEQRNKYICGE